ncbi:succinyl-CoA:acetate/propanoyl-CoA:succinate CoA transferase-like [Mytilus edulis]|uniref:succinyl-CoA:acetate/propanoyl-CoA:succinate CoA transferase-like n=1 Tax=Mytilus edulis TaxID=6550 RepID=UPI0039EEBE1C
MAFSLRGIHSSLRILDKFGVGHTRVRSFYLYAPEPFHPLADTYPQNKTADEAVQVIQSGHKVFIHGAAATPLPLIEAMCDHGRNSRLKNVELIHLHTEGAGRYNNPEYQGIFRSNSLFLAANSRSAVSEGRADSTPIFLYEIPLLFRLKKIELDVALISVTPPDKHGFCSLGPSVDCTRAAIQNAKYIIGATNKNLPRTIGDGMIHQSHLDAIVDCNFSIPELSMSKPTQEEKKIGRLIADNLVEDGATLQMGIGSIPNAVLAELTDHKDLGVHSEMFSDGVVDLVENGNITNALKNVQTGKTISTFAIGTKRLYDFMDNNPFVEMCDVSFTNSTAVICQNPKVTAINSCIEVDLGGQVCADSIGERIYSGFGGQIDFISGAALSLDGRGKPIIAMTSSTKRGESKIVNMLKNGSGVVTTRAHVHYIVTEYGIAYLFGKNLRQRAYELIKIAHPNHRERLEKEAYERMKCMPSPY